MKNIVLCTTAFFIFIIQFSCSLLVLNLFELNPNGLADLISIFSANATVFGTLVIIFGFNQWKDQSNIQLNRELALKASDNIANERDAITQIYALMKITYASFRQFSSQISDPLTVEASEIFETEWEKYVEASCLVERNLMRLSRINKDNSIKKDYEEYKSICRVLTGIIEYLYNFKYQSQHHNRNLKESLGIEVYEENFNKIEVSFEAFKKISKKMDTSLDKYIVIEK